MFFYLYRVTLAEFLRLKRVVVWVLISALLAGAAYLYMQMAREPNAATVYTRMTDSFVYRLIPLVAAVYSIAVVSQEVSQRTIVYLVTRPIPRWILYLARLAASITATYLISIVSILFVSMAINGITHPFTNALGGDLYGVVFAAFAYVSLFVLFSLWINKSMVAILLYAFGLESLAGTMPGDIGLLSIKSYVSVIAAKPVLSTGNPIADAAASQNALMDMTSRTAVPIMIIFSVVCMALGAWWFSKFEYVPREDAE